MSDPRPAPQYGEYATPEQQAKAMGLAYVPPVPVPPAPEPSAPPIPPPPVQPGLPQRAAPTRRANFADRYATILLLGFGVLSVVSSDYFHISEEMNTVSTTLGLGIHYPAAIDHSGAALLIGNIVLLALTILWAIRNIRRGRLSFYVPIVGWAAFFVFTFFVLMLSM